MLLCYLSASYCRPAGASLGLALRGVPHTTESTDVVHGCLGGRWFVQAALQRLHANSACPLVGAASWTLCEYV